MTDDAVTVARLDALRESVEHLHALVTPMSDGELEAPAYPSQWRIADVLSHIGSAAVIMGERISTGLRGKSLPDEFSPAVWDEWNAKSPRAKADDGLAADRAFLDRLLGATDEERAAVTISLGPMSFDFGGIIGLRLNEHVLHTWDVEVAGDPVVGLSRAGTPLVVDSLELIARYTGKPSAAGRTIAVRTTDPGRDFSVTTGPESVGFAPGASSSDADLTIPAEALVRLVYGRLDPGHTPAVEGDGALLDDLRAVFPGP